jgi:hypothetical protein
MAGFLLQVGELGFDVCVEGWQVVRFADQFQEGLGLFFGAFDLGAEAIEIGSDCAVDKAIKLWKAKHETLRLQI